MNNYNFFFNKIDYHLSKGKGFSFFGATEADVKNFIEQCKKFSVNLKLVKSSDGVLSNYKSLKNSDLIIVFQDNRYDDFIPRIQLLVDKIIFPLWFQKKTICFFSILNKSDYNKQKLTDLIHIDYSQVIKLLLCEQMLNLLERVNYEFTSAEFIKYDKDQILLTSIEQKLKEELDRNLLQYEIQKQKGNYYIDFLVTNQDVKTAIECDGRGNHIVENSNQMDTILQQEGYRILNFTYSDLINDIKACISKIISNNSLKDKPRIKIDTDLDESQKKAHSLLHGPIRVLAPAGSGKTKTLINRIVNLVNNGISPNGILALAFNKKASDEMKFRLANKLLSEVEVRTFHSLGYEIVQEKLGWKFDAANEQSVMKELLRKAIKKHYELPLRRNIDPLDAFIDAISKTKMEILALTDVNVEFDDKILPLKPVFESYLALQKSSNFFTFDDMIYFAIRILLADANLRKYYQNKFQFILVDEFQDLNRAQLLFLQILSLPENNIFIVGDDDQMIYGWRGADARHIIEFNTRYPISQDCTLSTNYRSSKKIVIHSNWLIQNNKNRIEKNIHPRADANVGKIEIELKENLWDQAQIAADWIIRFKSENNLDWKDFAVLFRLNAYQFLLSVVFDLMEIPHTPVDQTLLFKTRVGWDLYAYLSVILHPELASAEDFERILKRPNKYFSNDFISHIKNWIAFQNATDILNNDTLMLDKYIDFQNRIFNLNNLASLPSTNTYSFLTQLDTELELSSFYKEQTRLSNEIDGASDEIIFEVIITVARNFNQLESFYQYIKLCVQSIKQNILDEKPIRNEVIFSTIHKTKGNEFPNVVYFNLSLKYHQITDSELEEERRVAYVGVTRAKDNILITSSINKPSLFLIELAFNPKLKTISTNKLESEIATNTRIIQVLLNKIEILIAKKNYLFQKFPELHSKQTIKSYSWIKNIFYWWRLKKIDAASKKSDKINNKIYSIQQNQIIPLVQINEMLKTEVYFRKKILKV